MINKIPFSEIPFKNSSIEEEIDEVIKETKSRTKVENLFTHIDFVRRKGGEDAVEKVFEEMKRLGIYKDFGKMKRLDSIDGGISVAFVLLSKKYLNWSDKEIFEMGYEAPRISFIVKTLMRQWLSVETVLKVVSKYWDTHYETGKLECVEYDKEERKIVLRLDDYHCHPAACAFFQGYFLGIARFVINSDDLKIEQTKYMYKGDPYHEFVLTW